MMGLLAEAGATITSDAETADVLVVNTCSFIDKAKQESVDTILEMAQHKTAGKAQRLVVAGCMVERYRDEIQKNIPEVDAVVGTGELEQILTAAGLTSPTAQSADRFPVSHFDCGRSQPLPIAPKAITARRKVASPAKAGTAPSPACRIISTTSTRRACAPRRAVRPTSKSRKAAIIPAASASFRRFAANFARAGLSLWLPKWSDWSPKACRKSR